MSSLDKREEGFEKKFALDEEQKFKAIARRNKLLGLWAAEKLGLQTYTALGCTGTARVDMLIDEKAKKVYLNEVNPLPGDLYAHNWNRAGVSNVELVQKLIDLAKERHSVREALTTTFDTNYLKQF